MTRIRPAAAGWQGERQNYGRKKHDASSVLFVCALLLIAPVPSGSSIVWFEVFEPTARSFHQNTRRHLASTSVAPFWPRGHRALRSAIPFDWDGPRVGPTQRASFQGHAQAMATTSPPRRDLPTSAHQRLFARSLGNKMPALRSGDLAVV